MNVSDARAQLEQIARSNDMPVWRPGDDADAGVAKDDGRAQAMMPLTAMTPRSNNMGGAAPPSADADDPVALGRAAWERRKADTTSWDDWKLVGAAIMIGHEQAVATAGRSDGKNYSREFGHWLQLHGFDDFDAADRAKLLVLMKDLEQVEAWRSTLTETERRRRNHPSTVWRAWTCRNRGGRWRLQQADVAAHAPSLPSAASPAPEAAQATPVDPAVKETKRWFNAVYLHAVAVLEDAKILDGEISPELRQTLCESVEPKLQPTLRKAGAALIAMADFVGQLVDEPSEQLRAAE